MTAERDPGRVVILGCGPLGCGVAWRLQEAGFDDFLILEQSEGPGGLSASAVDPEGFTWDQGGHVQFSHYSYYDRVLDETVDRGWLWHERESWVWIRERFVPYPFQNNIHRLDPAERSAIVQGLRQAALAREHLDPQNFRDWILATFGGPLAEIFMLPYNFKVWGHPLEQMDWRWIGERVAVPDVARIERNIAEHKDDLSWGPNNKFRFPAHGGTGAIWTGVSQRIASDCIRYGSRVVAVDTENRRLGLASGETLRFDTLISSLPLDSLIAISDPLPIELQA